MKFTCKTSRQVQSEHSSRPTADGNHGGRGDGRELYYLQTDGSLMQVTVRPGEHLDLAAPTALLRTTPTNANSYRMDYVPSGDGKRFLMKVPVKQAPPVITIVVNWPALLDSANR